MMISTSNFFDVPNYTN